MYEDPAFSPCQAIDSYNVADDSYDNQQNELNEKGMQGSVPDNNVPISASIVGLDTGDDIAEETSNMADLEVTDNASVEESTGEDQLNLSTEDVDMLLDKCLFQALYTTVKDKDLPMAGSTLW